MERRSPTRRLSKVRRAGNQRFHLLSSQGGRASSRAQTPTEEGARDAAQHSILAFPPGSGRTEPIKTPWAVRRLRVSKLELAGGHLCEDRKSTRLNSSHL